MKTLFLFLALFVTPCFAQLYRCEMPSLKIQDSPWPNSSDFLSLEFTGPRAASVFPHFEMENAQFFSVVVHKEWCQELDTAILCETPKDALVELYMGENAGSPLKKSSLRYFILILDYNETGWAFLKVRAQRMDDHPPVTYHTEFPVGSCKTEN